MLRKVTLMPGRPRTPTNILLLNGADKNHPERLKERENEPENVNPLGSPPMYLSDDEIKFWEIIEKESIPGVLGEADRQSVALAAKLLAIVWGDEGASSAQINQLTKLLSQFGMTPADRSKISIPGQKKKNAFDD